MCCWEWHVEGVCVANVSGGIGLRDAGFVNESGVRLTCSLTGKNDDCGAADAVCIGLPDQ